MSHTRRLCAPDHPLAFLLALAGFILLLSSVLPVWAQSASGTISGTVTDTTGAVIPGAHITLQNTASGTNYDTVSNGSGYFFFAAVPPATYKLTIRAQGFATFVATGIIEHLGENHDIPSLALPVASASTNVQVTASEAGVIPLDTGESTTTLNTEMVQNISIQGRDAAELVKFMPGMAMNNGLSQSSFNDLTTQTNNGPIGSYSASGTQPYGSMQMTMDGSSLIDIGNMGTQLANVNQDQTAEFTYLNAAFGADTPRGPNIIQVASKAGGRDFHGDIYTYLRDWQANANDAYYKAANPGASRPMDHEIYPGATIGGPVLIPGLGFNRRRDKLFFFAGYENMRQNPFPTLHYLVMPTTDMINGDFSAATLPGAQSSSSTWWDTAQVPCSNAANWTSFCPNTGSSSNPVYPDGNPFPGGKIPQSYWDSDGRALMSYLNKVHPPNIDPATHNGYNFQYLDNPPVNRWELRLRGDYDMTANDKFNVVYTQQNEGDIGNFGVWWQPGQTAPLPTPMAATTIAKLWSASYVRVLSPTTTNEFNFGYTYFTFPPTFANPSAMMASTAGYTTYAPFDTSATNSFDQIPDLISWNDSLGNYNGDFPGIYTPATVKAFNNAFGNIKKVYSFQDNFTRVISTHSLKAGFFWDSNNQIQTTNDGDWTQGMIDVDPYGQYTTGNPLADLLIGHLDGMTQYASAPVHNMAYHEWAIYGQDQWRVTRKLTLDYGVRFDHDGQWYPTQGNGLAVWDPASYNDTANASQWTGMKWHQIDSKVPQSGFVSRLLYPDVRGGFAYDIHGNGKMVLRAGAGIYRWQFSEGDIDPATLPSWNVLSITTGGTESFAQLATFKPQAGSWCALPQGAASTSTNSAYGGNTCPTGVDAIQQGENATPYTMNWDVMLDQELPARMVFELQYIGNHTDDALFTGNGTTENFIANINKIPLGAFWGTYHLPGAPNDGQNLWQMSCNNGSCAAPGSYYYSGYRPYKNYGVLNVIHHGSYSNYNGMVAALQKQTGRGTFMVNYTWSKVMGIRDGQTDNGVGDGPTVAPFNIRANYGPLAYDRTQIFNATYSANLPNFNISNRLLKIIANGWQGSGDFQMQSGPPLQPNTGGNMNLAYQSGSFTPGNGYYLGTTAEPLMPYLTCDPRSGGGKYFNPKCFETPTTIGQNGPSIWPDIKGPANLNTDLGIYKNFAVTERQSLQFRATAFNFINHALPQFNLTSDDSLHMGCTSTGGVEQTCAAGSGNTNTLTTGTPKYEIGRRVMEVALKYYF